jgi:autotransporter-associated beta strand protein
LQVANNAGNSALSSAANLVIGTNGTLQLSAQTANPTTTVSELSGSGLISYSGGNNSILSFGGSAGGTWNGTIRDAGAGGLSLTKSGTGTWVVGGSNYLNNSDFFNAISQVQFNRGNTVLTNGSLLAAAYTEIWIAQGAGSTGTVIVAGGTLAVSNNWLCVGRGDATANGTLIVNSGTVLKAGANNLVVGSSGATGALIVNGGQVRNNGMLWLGENATGNGALQLNGGLVQATQVRPNNTPLTSIANFNGGTLQASAASLDFIQSTANVQSGGLVLDDGGFVVTLLSVPLQEDPSSTGGGLVKQGSGTVYLDNANTYTGTTLVSAGTLAGAGSINGPVVVGPAGRLGAGDEAGLGILSLNTQPLTVQGTVTLRINKTGGTPTSDLITGISIANYGGTLSISNATADATPLVLGDSFTLFSTAAHTGNFATITGSPGSGLAYSFNATSGVLSVVAGTASYPTNITSSVSGNTLSLSWPATHAGWILQTQTNSLNVGLNTTWADVPGSAAVTSMNVTINPANPTVFFRLRNP